MSTVGAPALEDVSCEDSSEDFVVNDCGLKETSDVFYLVGDTPDAAEFDGFLEETKQIARCSSSCTEKFSGTHGSSSLAKTRPTLLATTPSDFVQNNECALKRRKMMSDCAAEKPQIVYRTHTSTKEERRKYDQNLDVNFHKLKDELTECHQIVDASKKGNVSSRTEHCLSTNRHTVAERVRRERISERMRFLQNLVPGCNKITGKAHVLDETINYVKSLQYQVQFLSMKLAAFHPEFYLSMEQDLPKTLIPEGYSNPYQPHLTEATPKGRTRTGLIYSQHNSVNQHRYDFPYDQIEKALSSEQCPCFVFKCLKVLGKDVIHRSALSEQAID